MCSCMCLWVQIEERSVGVISKAGRNNDWMAAVTGLLEVGESRIIPLCFTIALIFYSGHWEQRIDKLATYIPRSTTIL